MKKLSCLFAVCVILSTLWGCGWTTHAKSTTEVQKAPPPSNVKIKVVDVSNDTREVFDVDVIGMMWSALDESLKGRGMLWTSASPGAEEGSEPLHLDAHIIKYQEGSLWMRSVLPRWGKTVLTAKFELKDGDHLVASAETTRSISIGHESFTREAWKKVFSEVAADFVKQIAKKKI